MRNQQCTVLLALINAVRGELNVTWIRCRYNVPSAWYIRSKEGKSQRKREMLKMSLISYLAFCFSPPFHSLFLCRSFSVSSECSYSFSIQLLCVYIPSMKMRISFDDTLWQIKCIRSVLDCNTYCSMYACALTDDQIMCKFQCNRLWCNVPKRKDNGSGGPMRRKRCRVSCCKCALFRVIGVLPLSFEY